MILNGRHIGLALVAAILKIERGSDQILIKHTLKNTYANFHAFMKFCTPKFVRSLAIGVFRRLCDSDLRERAGMYG